MSLPKCRAVITIAAFVLTCAASTALSAELRCDKNLGPAEKIICNSEKLVWLDQQLNFLESLQQVHAGKSRSNLDASEMWTRQRDGCLNEKCMSDAYLQRIDQLISSAINLSSKALTKGQRARILERIAGTYEGEDTASMSIYGTFTISASNIAWTGFKNRNLCQAGFDITRMELWRSVPDAPKDYWANKLSPWFESYVLTLKPNECSTTKIFRVVLISTLPNSMLLVDYEQGAAGHSRFSKK